MAAPAAPIEQDLLGLCGPFTSIARTMSRQWHVRVIADGTRCETDGKVIRIPFTADHLPAGHRQVLHGMLDHEVCHVIEERVAAEMGEHSAMTIFHAERNPTLKMLFNAFEDIRIELKWEKEYPGVAENLRACNRHAVERIRSKPELFGNPWMRLGAAIIFRARGFETEWCGELEPLLALVSDEIAQSRVVRTPTEAYDLAVSVYEKVRSQLPKKPASLEASSGADAEDEAEPGSAEAGIFVEAAAEASGEEHEEDEGTEEDEDDGSVTAVDSPVTDLLDVVRDEIERAVRDDATAHDRYIPDPEARKLDQWIAVEPRDKQRALENYRRSHDEVRSQIALLRARQLMHLQSIARRRIVAGLETGELDNGLVHAVRAGGRDVFFDVRPGVQLNTAIFVLLDLSGSMRDGDLPGTPAYYTKRTAIALVEAWEALHIPSMFVGFHNNHGRAHWSSFAPSGAVVQRSPFDFFVFKRWHEPLSRCRARFSEINGRNDNVDGEAVFAAACELVRRREHRKILVVISDGRPAHRGVSPVRLENHLVEVVTQITRAGVEVLGVGAGTDVPKQFYNEKTGATSVVVRDLNRLAPELFAALRTRLIARKI